ncbi:APC family permease [Pseudomonas extremaustralis]|uniref:APC family permease n=1 Tax=Pseudomonas extremaustralis TaxID=359110 RepID=UPI0021C863FF|nr:APC family permease [Pseudomonas extremaustralis]UUJ40883.1 APC family permease [Pseudomonas extremaustralis]
MPDATPTKLSLTSLTAFGLAYMCPSLAMVIFGVISDRSGGIAPSAFLLATGAMLLSALSYAKLSRLFPVSGSAYYYAKRLLGPGCGFVVGWAVLLAYLFMPMVAWLLQSVFLNAQFPQIPTWAWLLINIGLTTAVTVSGMALTDRLNKLLTFLSVALVLLFIGYCLRYVAGQPQIGFTDAAWNDHSTLTGLTAAAAIAAYSFLGFDAVTTLAEEAEQPKRDIPRAVLLVICLGGLLFTAVAYLMQLSHPGGQFADPETATYALSLEVGGQFFADFINLGGIVGGFASCLAVQVSASRLLYFMGREGVLPARYFARLQGKARTPVFNLLLIAGLGLIGICADVSSGASLINFGAFLAFAAVNACVITYYLRERHRQRLSGVGFVVLPVLAIGVNLYLLSLLSTMVILAGVAWLVCGGLYLTWLTAGFCKPTPGLVEVEP